MLISIHTHEPHPTAHIGPKIGEDAIFIEMGSGHYLQMSAAEAAHLVTELEQAITDIDVRDQVRSTELDIDPLASLPLFDDADA